MKYCRVVQISVVVLIFMVPGLHAQELTSEITNVELKSETEVVITYNLVGDPKADYEVEVILLNEKEPDFELKLTTVSGDVGKGKFAGQGRKLMCNIGVDFPGVAVGENYRFKLIASKVSGGGVPWYIYAGGSVVVGGLAILLTASKEEPVTPEKKIPLPPSR